MFESHLSGLLVAASIIGSANPTAAAVHIDGQVQAGGGPVAGSTVTLWAGSSGEPKQLAQARTADDGSFALSTDETPGLGASLYVIAKGGVPLGQQERGRQSGAGVSDGAGRDAPTAPDHQRDDDHRIGLDQRAVPRQRGDQGAGAEPEHCRQQCAQFRRSFDRRMGRDHPGPAQQRPDAHHGQLRYARRCARRLRDSGHAHRLRNAFPSGQVAEGRRAERYADGGRGRRALSLVSARPSVCVTRRVLSGSDWQEPAPGSIHALSQHRAERLGAAAQIRRRRLSRGRQGGVRQRGQSVGWRQLHHRLAGVGCALAGSRHQVRAERPSAVANHHGLHWRRHGGRHLRGGGRR